MNIYIYIYTYVFITYIVLDSPWLSFPLEGLLPALSSSTFEVQRRGRSRGSRGSPWLASAGGKTIGKPMGKWWFNGKTMENPWENG